uniref:glycosyltransferase family 4 protein n=1 Tax=Stappia sp. TaxID=1870903 RepID=UPI003BAB4A4B
MRIIQVCPYDMARPGGVQAHVRDLSGFLNVGGHETRMVAPRPVAGGAVPGVEHCGAARLVSMFSTRFEVSLAGPGELRALVSRLKDEFRADIVHLHTPWTPLVAWQVWRRLDLPMVATFHATLPGRDATGLSARLLRRAGHHFLAHARALVVPSPSPLAHLSPPSGLRVDVIPPSVDLTAWREQGRARHAMGKTSADGPEILFLGRFEPRKGLDVLLAAWPEVAARVPGARLTIAGGGSLEPLVHAAMSAPHGERIVLVPSPDDNAARVLMAKADIFAAPAPFGESFGIVLIEAMAGGAVPVAAANDGYASVLAGGGEELLVPPGDASALAARLVALAGDAPTLSRLRDWGATRSSALDIVATGPSYLALYEDALASS